MSNKFPMKNKYNHSMEVKRKLSKIFPMRVDTTYSTRILSIIKVLKAESQQVLYDAGINLAFEEFQGIEAQDLSSALAQIADLYMNNSLGKLVMDGVGKNFLLVRNYDCATCVSAKNDGKTYCWLDAGFIAGALKQMLNEDYVVIETKCHGTGAEYCEFLIAKKRRVET